MTHLLPTHDFVAFMQHLASCYPEKYDNISKDRLAIWQRAVQHHDLDTLKESVIDDGAHATFPPVPKDITDTAKRIKSHTLDAESEAKRRQDIVELEEKREEGLRRTEEILKDCTDEELNELRAKVLKPFKKTSPVHRLTVKSTNMRHPMAKAKADVPERKGT